MPDPRYKKLAEVLTGYSTALKRGDTVLFDVTDTPDAFAVELARAARKRGAIPLIETRSGRIVREMLMNTSEQHARTVRDVELHRMKKCDAYVAVRGSLNATENSDIQSDNMSMYSRTLRPVLNYRVNKTRWVVIRWPNGCLLYTSDAADE